MTAEPGITVHHVWTSVGTPDHYVERLPVRVCAECAALVPIDRYGEHLDVAHRAMGR